ncbi:uncharacterized protein TNCV_1179181 [Trichonephila clavipes]|nr:uncharacterized protein TNCV_1179181 [Trichonephila clavipes]
MQVRTWPCRDAYSNASGFSGSVIGNHGCSTIFSTDCMLEETLVDHVFVRLEPQIQDYVEVITAQGAKCRNVGIIELQVRIREFVKPPMFLVLADLEYPCILSVDFISGSKILLDFDGKALAIPDSHIEKVVTTTEEGNAEVDLTKIGLEESQKHEL